MDHELRLASQLLCGSGQLQEYRANTAGSAAALLGVLQFIIGGLAAPLVSIGGKDTAVPMTVIMASFGLLALLTFSVLTRRKGAAEPVS